MTLCAAAQIASYQSPAITTDEPFSSLRRIHLARLLRSLAIVLTVAILILWGGYGFTFASLEAS